MTKTILLVAAIFSSATLLAQVSFTNQSSMIGDFPESSEIAVDINEDGLDDYVRISSVGVGIDYQQADGTFNSVMRSMTIQNPPDWSVAAGDLNKDGFLDFVLGNASRVSFLYSSSDGTSFIEDTSHTAYIFSQRSTMADIDLDGNIDSFVCHDVDLSHPYRNDGFGNMTEDQSLIETINLPGNYAALWVDYDNDGDQDMYLTKCRGGSSPGDVERDNAMYTNNGDGTFTENALDIGMRDNAQSWSTVFEDFDNDGDFDAFIVNHDFQNRFMINDGTGNFTDIIETTGINPTDLGAWENQAGDFNNDGYVDIFSEMSKELYINNGDLTFTGQDLPFDEGAIGDLNNDGYLDVVNDGNLYINDGGTNNYIKFTLQGVESNINGIGARIVITSNLGTQMREVRSGEGFSHMNSLTAHFGLGTDEAVESVFVHWPNGLSEEIEDLDINTTHLILEGEGVVLGNTVFEREGITLFPNPTAALLNFSLEGLENTPVTVTDVNGRVVINTNISQNKDINVASLNAGTYFVQLEVENKAVSYKFVKK
ncbi:hypothetical protein SCB49_04275 [unidentified eubacterium SCB49]|nr:hypothetical protein SCB49_04275 [unidentified eubacterium SCB49]